jgi:hypothetical protein
MIAERFYSNGQVFSCIHQELRENSMAEERGNRTIRSMQNTCVHVYFQGSHARQFVDRTPLYRRGLVV